MLDKKPRGICGCSKSPDIPLTDFDLKTTGGILQIFKLLVPCLPPNEQRTMAIFIRIWELMLTVKFFEEQCFTYNNKHDIFDPELLSHMRKYCTKDNQAKIDKILNLLSMSDMLSTMNTLTDLSSVLSGNQESLYKDFMNKLDKELKC